MFNLDDMAQRIRRATNFTQAYPGKFCPTPLQLEEVEHLLAELARLREENARLRGIIMAKNMEVRA